MDNDSDEEVDRNIREIFGDSDDESDLNLSFDEEELEDNLALACLRRSEESKDEDMFELTSDEEEEEVKEIEEWLSGIVTHEDFDFDETSVGPTKLLLPNKSALDFFHIIFTQDVYDLIVTQTNLYTSQQRMEPRNQKQSWSDLTVGEFKTWLGLYLAMGIVKKPSLRDYSSQSPLTQTPGIAAVMTRDRFFQIMRYIHFVDNASDIAQKSKDSPDYDKLYKIRDLLNLIKRNAKGALNLERNIAIDETLVKFKGRVSFREFLPNKPGRFGVKNFTLSESSSGYVWDLDVYTGKSGHDPQKGLAHHVVRKLVQVLEGKGFNLFVDNWYSSPQLFEELAEEKILVCGTVRANRKGLPKDNECEG